MATGRKATLIRLLKPIVAGVALAYLLTAFVDKPAPVHFQPENPYAAKQEEIVKPQAEMVLEKNIMKLGSPLSVQAGNGDVKVKNNPLAPLESMAGSPDSGSSNAEAADANATTSVRGEVDSTPADSDGQPAE